MKTLNGPANHSVSISSKKKRIFYEQFLKHSKFEKRLLFTLVIVFGLLVALILIIFIRRQSPDLCTTKSCVISAARLMEEMNESVDPCHEFYEYACGKYKDVKFYPHETDHSPFIDRSRYFYYRLKEMLEDDTPPDMKPLQQMREVYEMCMDTDRLNEQGLDPLFEVLDSLELPRGFPNDEHVKNFSLARTLSLSERLLNFDTLIEFDVHYNDTLNSTFLSLGPGLSHSFMFKEKRFEGKGTGEVTKEWLVFRLAYMVGVISELDITGFNSLNDSMEDIVKILVLECQFKKDSEESETRGGKSCMTLTQLHEYMFSNVTEAFSHNEVLFDWQEYLSTLTEGLNITITKDYVVCVKNPIYFRMLGKKLAALEMLLFQRLIWWEVVDALGIHTTDKIRTHHYIFEERALSNVEKPTRIDDCTAIVKTLFMDFISYKIISSYDGDVHNAIRNVDSTVSDIKSTFVELISNSVWMNKGMKLRYTNKLDNVKVIIGFPPDLENSSWIINSYAKMKVVPDNFFKTLRNFETEEVADMLKNIHDLSLRPPDELLSWNPFTPLVTNALYNEDSNVLIIPYGILHIPFYADGVHAVNYGAIGSIIGHEFTHSFQFQMLYDINKRWKKINIDEKVECFVQQYKSFHVKDRRVDGDETLLENIADYSGVKAAHFAYKKRLEKYGSEFVLPGLEKFTDQQLFFLSYASVSMIFSFKMFCGKEGLPESSHGFNSDHSPSRFRVLGSLQNLPEFSKAWNCPLGSPMHPETRCKLW